MSRSSKNPQKQLTKKTIFFDIETIRPERPQPLLAATRIFFFYLFKLTVLFYLLKKENLYKIPFAIPRPQETCALRNFWLPLKIQFLESKYLCERVISSP